MKTTAYSPSLTLIITHVLLAFYGHNAPSECSSTPRQPDVRTELPHSTEPAKSSDLFDSSTYVTQAADSRKKATTMHTCLFSSVRENESDALITAIADIKKSVRMSASPNRQKLVRELEEYKVGAIEWSTLADAVDSEIRVQCLLQGMLQYQRFVLSKIDKLALGDLISERKKYWDRAGSIVNFRKQMMRLRSAQQADVNASYIARCLKSQRDNQELTELLEKDPSSMYVYAFEEVVDHLGLDKSLIIDESKLATARRKNQDDLMEVALYVGSDLVPLTTVRLGGRVMEIGGFLGAVILLEK